MAQSVFWIRLWTYESERSSERCQIRTKLTFEMIEVGTILRIDSSEQIHTKKNSRASLVNRCATKLFAGFA